MRSQQLDLKKYDTDKIDNRYLERYDPFFGPLADRPVKLLELGVFRGGSVRLWQDYFPNGQIIGVDVELPPGMIREPRIKLHKGSQGDAELLRRVAAEHAPDGFDIIIDDAAHVGELAKASFDVLFDAHLKPGGWYVIEDWPTGYFEDWADGVSALRKPGFLRRVGWRLFRSGLPALKKPWANHSHGLVGFVKQLIDEQAAADISRGKFGGAATRESRFESMTVTPTIVFIKKKG